MRCHHDLVGDKKTGGCVRCFLEMLGRIIRKRHECPVCHQTWECRVAWCRLPLNIIPNPQDSCWRRHAAQSPGCELRWKVYGGQ